MLDALKTELQTGDTVAFINSYDRSLTKGTVVGFTAKQIQVMVQEIRWNKEAQARIPTDVVIARPPEYVAKIG